MTTVDTWMVLYFPVYKPSCGYKQHVVASQPPTVTEDPTTVTVHGSSIHLSIPIQTSTPTRHLTQQSPSTHTSQKATPSKKNHPLGKPPTTNTTSAENRENHKTTPTTYDIEETQKKKPAKRHPLHTIAARRTDDVIANEVPKVPASNPFPQRRMDD